MQSIKSYNRLNRPLTTDLLAVLNSYTLQSVCITFECWTLCLLGNFACFFVVCCFISKSTFSNKYSCRTTIRKSNSLDPTQAQRNVGPDLGPNCLQKLSADDTSRQRVNIQSKIYLFMILDKPIHANKIIQWNTFLSNKQCHPYQGSAP